jgi:hypothetical protein
MIRQIFVPLVLGVLTSPIAAHGQSECGPDGCRGSAYYEAHHHHENDEKNREEERHFRGNDNEARGNQGDHTDQGNPEEYENQMEDDAASRRARFNSGLNYGDEDHALYHSPHSADDEPTTSSSHGGSFDPLPSVPDRGVMPYSEITGAGDDQ